MDTFRSSSRDYSKNSSTDVTKNSTRDFFQLCLQGFLLKFTRISYIIAAITQKNPQESLPNIPVLQELFNYFVQEFPQGILQEFLRRLLRELLQKFLLRILQGFLQKFIQKLFNTKCHLNYLKHLKFLVGYSLNFLLWFLQVFLHLVLLGCFQDFLQAFSQELLFLKFLQGGFLGIYSNNPPNISSRNSYIFQKVLQKIFHGYLQKFLEYFL